MADDADRAQETQERLEHLHRQKLAAKRIIPRASDFCIDCGELIESIRLKVAPDALRCVYCQSEQERMERQYAR